MNKKVKILIIIVVFILISVIIIKGLINKNKRTIICIDARTWRNRCWSSK